MNINQNFDTEQYLKQQSFIARIIGHGEYEYNF